MTDSISLEQQFSHAISKEEADKLRPLPEKQKALESELKKTQAKTIPATLSSDLSFSTNVTYGKQLDNFAEPARSFQKRDCYAIIDKYIHGKIEDKVCVVYGLRRTGKTTLLKQLLLSFNEAQKARTAYLKCTAKDTVAALNKDIAKLRDAGFAYLFIDEVTLMDDFIDSASLFSDIYAAQGIKIVLSGTDSLGFHFAIHDELYDRAVMVHTTFISYREHSRLLGHPALACML